MDILTLLMSYMLVIVPLLVFALLTCCDRVKKVIIYKNYSYSDVLRISNF